MRRLTGTILLMGMMLSTSAVQAQTYDPRYPVCVQLATIDGTSIGCGYVLWLSVRRRQQVVGPNATPTRFTDTQTRRRRGAPIRTTAPIIFSLSASK